MIDRISQPFRVLAISFRRLDSYQSCTLVAGYMGNAGYVSDEYQARTELGTWYK